MAKFTNSGEGPRGIVTKDGGTVWAEPGETIEVENADKVHPDFNGGDADNAEPGPLDSSVEDLTAYLAGITDEAEIDRLIEAETAGKSRKGALAALEARKEETAGE